MYKRETQPLQLRESPYIVVVVVKVLEVIATSYRTHKMLEKKLTVTCLETTNEEGPPKDSGSGCAQRTVRMHEQEKHSAPVVQFSTGGSHMHRMIGLCPCLVGDESE